MMPRINIVEERTAPTPDGPWSEPKGCAVTNREPCDWEPLNAANAHLWTGRDEYWQSRVVPYARVEPASSPPTQREP
jgi:hypothetical protein